MAISLYGDSRERLFNSLLRPQVVIDGFSLSHAVRACFNQVQRGADPAEFDCPPLALKKWGLREQDTVHDIVCLGAEPVTAYDNLIVGRIGTSSVHTYVACGYRPMLAVYSTLGVDRPFFSAAALATKVASKLGAAMFGVVSSFWGKAKEPELGSHHGSGEQSVRTSSRPLSDVAKQGAAALPLEYALDDRRRRIVSLEPCPLGNAIAATDDFGRVLLLDSASGTITNVWKGYREAQVGWVLAKENTASRSCSYLVIYAPRRGLLEVWAPSLQFRAAAWNVGLEARLVQRISVPGSEFSDCFVMLADGCASHPPILRPDLKLYPCMVCPRPVSCTNKCMRILKVRCERSLSPSVQLSILSPVGIWKTEGSSAPYSRY